MPNSNDISQSLWSILNKMRGKVDVNEYKNYILPFIFYSYAVFKVDQFMEEELKNDNITYKDAWDKVDDNGNLEYRDILITTQLDKFGFVIEPDYFIKPIYQRAWVGVDYFGDVFEKAIKSFDEYCTESFRGTLGMVNCYNDALGENQYQIDDRLKELFIESYNVAKQAFLSKTEVDILGNIYEELMGYFAASAGKKGGEFYTPSKVSELVAMLATYDIPYAESISDPTCGSGSLLIKAAKQIEANGGRVGIIYGQELNAVTSRLAKMNMAIHNISSENFRIDCVDTLNDNDNSEGHFFDVTVANPPYAIGWDNGEYRYTDARFSGYGALAPRSNADFAFVQHIVYHMKDTGHAAVLLPLGVLFRGNAEQTIRQALIETYNVIDAIIVLPSNMFYGASIPVCCLVLRKDRGDKNDICFIDASNEFVKDGKKNKLTDDNIEKIYNAFVNREDIEHFCSIVDREIIAENDYNLNIPLYVEAEKITDDHDLGDLFKEFAELEQQEKLLKQSINLQLKAFGFEQQFNA